jgi:hypothetical protein
METSKRNEELEALLKSSREARSEAIAFLKEQGIDFQPGQWLTIKRYCEKFGIADPQTVTDWIEKGVIPSENVHVLKDFEHITLIKAVPYQV